MNIQEKVLELMTLAVQLRQDNVAHVFVHYYGHVNCIDIQASPSDQIYDDYSPIVRLFDTQHISLDGEDTHQQLDKAIALLRGLVEKEEAA